MRRLVSHSLRDQAEPCVENMLEAVALRHTTRCFLSTMKPFRPVP